MAGLIGIGRNTLGQANVGFQQSANLEDSRNAMGMQLRQARAAQRASMVTTGAGLGGSIGVNNLMAGGNFVPASASQALAVPAAVTGAAPVAVAGEGAMVAGELASQLGAISAPASGIAGASTAAGTAAITGAAPVAVSGLGAAAPVAGELVGTLGTMTAPASGIGASTGALAGIGAIATPLLIGAGAALLLDSMFDIF